MAQRVQVILEDDLDAANDQVPGFRQPGVVAVGTGQGACIDRVIPDEGGLDEAVLHELLEELEDDLTR